MSGKHTILGSGGPIGIELAKALTKYTTDIRLVARNPKKINPGDELVKADVLDDQQLDKAVAGSSVVYITVGFPYEIKVWQQSWPKFIKSAIEACKKHECKMVFFDNIYMYDPAYLSNMTEETPLNPPSKKGKVRAAVVNLIMAEVKAGKLNALVARSADFYGPQIAQTSMLNETVVKPLSTGKKANWLGSTKFKHSFTFTPDAGAATALLGNTDDAFNQIWHLPTAPNPLTGQQWVELIAKNLGVKPGIQGASKVVVWIMGLFMPIMKEIYEMMYQYDRDYVFNSSKFEKRFGIEATPYEEGVKQMIQTDYPKK